MLIYLLLLIGICLTVSGQVFLKLGMNRVRTKIGAFSATPTALWKTFTEWRVILGFVLTFSASLFWLGVISRADFSFAYPLLAFSYVVALIPARLVLHEPLTSNRLIGALIVVIGVIVIGWSW